jgi:hypothetical protein
MLKIPGFICHADNARRKFPKYIHKIVLGGDHGLNGFVRLRGLIHAAAQQGDAALVQIFIAR